MMPAIEPGRVCLLARGRNAGKRAVVVEAGKGSIATVFRNGKKSKCNIRHLFPTSETVDPKSLKEKKPAEEKGHGKKVK